jgi:hypothetical protein
MTSPAPSERPEAPVFSDGLGDRAIAVDGATGDLLQILRLRPQLLAVPSFEFALRERAARLANFRHAYYARVRRIDRQGVMLSVVSDHVEGTRLSDLLRIASERRLTLDLNAALCLIRQLGPAVALLHENARDVAHGLIAPERLVVTPHARVIIVEHVLGSAVEQLQYSSERLWKDLGAVLHAGSINGRFDHRSDVVAIGMVALSLVLGRPISMDEYPHRIAILLQDARARSAMGEEEPLPYVLRLWLARMLQLDPGRSYGSAIEAQSALEDTLSEDMGFVAAPVALETFLSRYIASLLEPAVPEQASVRSISAPRADAPAPVPSIAASTPAQAAVPPAPVAAPPSVPRPVIQQPAAAPAPVASAPPIAPAPVAPIPVFAPVAPAPVVPASVAPAPAAPAPVAPPAPPAATAPATMAAPVASPAPVAAPPAPVVEAVSDSAPAVPDITDLLKDVAGVVPADPPADVPAVPAKRGGRGRKNFLRVAAAAGVVALLGVPGWYYMSRGAKAAAMSTGTLAVQTNPSGVAVFVDGVAHGNTPARVSVPAGSHILELRGRGVPRVVPIQIAAGAEVSQYLELPETPSTGSLLVQSDPVGARVAIDGTEHGVTPVSVADLTPGEHEVVLMGTSGVPVKQKVVIQAGVTASVLAPVSMAAPGPVSGWIAVKAPVEMDIREGGRLLGTSDSEKIMLAAGRHELQIVNETLGYSAKRVVQIPAGRILSVPIEMPQGVINLNATPWAEVWIDGKRIGETPIGNFPIAIGPHEVLFRNPQLGEKRQAVSVTLNAPVRLSVNMK